MMSVFTRLGPKFREGFHGLRSCSRLCSPADMSAHGMNRGNSLLINNGMEIFSTVIDHDGVIKDKKKLYLPMEGPLFISGPCNGQFCVYSSWKEVSLFNPATGGGITTFTLPARNNADVHSLGFGFDSKVNELKIVRCISCDFRNHRPNPRYLSHQGKQQHCIEVISLSCMQRREIAVLGEITARMPSASGVANVDGVCYWSAKDFHHVEMKIISFDFADDAFHIVSLPPCDYVNYNPYTEDCQVNVFKGLPAVIRYDANPDKYFEVWVKRKTWVKQMCIGPISDVIKPLCFWKNDGLVLLDSQHELVLYDFLTKQVIKLNIHLPEPIKSEDGNQPIIQCHESSLFLVSGNSSMAE